MKKTKPKINNIVTALQNSLAKPVIKVKPKKKVK